MALFKCINAKGCKTLTLCKEYTGSKSWRLYIWGYEINTVRVLNDNGNNVHYSPDRFVRVYD